MPTEVWSGPGPSTRVVAWDFAIMTTTDQNDVLELPDETGKSGKSGGTTKTLVQALQHLGKHGWELTEITSSLRGKMWIFKRPTYAN